MGRARLVVVIAVVCAVVTAAAIAYAAGKVSAPEVMRAQRFELLDSEGKVMAVLGVARHGPIVGGLRIVDLDGNTIIYRSMEEGEVVVSRGGAELPYLVLRDEEGRTRVEVTFDEVGDTAIRMTDRQGKVVFAVPPKFGVEMLAK